jgi:hypothetical protein
VLYAVAVSDNFHVVLTKRQAIELSLSTPRGGKRLEGADEAMTG